LTVVSLAPIARSVILPSSILTPRPVCDSVPTAFPKFALMGCSFSAARGVSGRPMMAPPCAPLGVLRSPRSHQSKWKRTSR
jgi:hypothetical protein